MSFPFFPPSHCWPRIFPTSLIWTAPFSLRLVNGPGGLSAALPAPPAALWILTLLKVKVLGWIARLLLLSLEPLPPPPHALPHYWLTRLPLPSAPHILQHPPSCPILPPLQQAQGRLVMQSERMFFIWTLPYTSGPVDPVVRPPIYNVILSNYFSLLKKKKKKSESHSTSTDNQHCNTASPETQFFPRVTVFFRFLFFFKAIAASDVVAQLSTSTCSPLCYVACGSKNTS